jgi:hypothetical protein
MHIAFRKVTIFRDAESLRAQSESAALEQQSPFSVHNN